MRVISGLHDIHSLPERQRKEEANETLSHEQNLPMLMKFFLFISMEKLHNLLSLQGCSFGTEIKPFLD